MATLMQTLKQLKAQWNRTQKELEALNRAIAALEKLARTGLGRGGRKRRQTGFARDRARLLRQRKGRAAT